MRVIENPQTRSGQETYPPLVSILMLNLDQPEMTARAVKAIRRTITDSPVEVLVVDNGSSQANFSLLCDLQPDAKIIRLNENIFFGEANNVAADYAQGGTLVFVNNDVIVEAGWLGPLLSALEETHVGLAGSVFINDEYCVLEAGAHISERGRVVHHHRGKKARELGDQPIEVPFVSAACIAIRKETFFAIGGFDFVFSPAYFEDADLCRRVAQQSLVTVVCPQSLVQHRENQTANKLFGRHELAVLKISNRLVFLTNRASQTGALVRPKVAEHVKLVSEDKEAPFAVYLPDGADFTVSTLLALALCAKLRERQVESVIVLPERCSKLKLAQLLSVFQVSGPLPAVRAVDEIDQSKLILQVESPGRSREVTMRLCTPPAESHSTVFCSRILSGDSDSRSLPLPVVTRTYDQSETDLLLVLDKLSSPSMLGLLRILAAVPVLVWLGRIQSRITVSNVSRPPASIIGRARYLAFASLSRWSSIPTLSSPFFGPHHGESSSAAKLRSLVFAMLKVHSGQKTRARHQGGLFIQALLRIAGVKAVLVPQEGLDPLFLSRVVENLAPEVLKLLRN